MQNIKINFIIVGKSELCQHIKKMNQLFDFLNFTAPISAVPLLSRKNS